MPQPRFLFTLICLLLSLAAGCQSAAPPAAATTTPADTAVPSPTALPTATSLPPSPTPSAIDETAVPTATFTPLPSATATPPPTATPAEARLPAGDIFTVYDPAQPVLQHGETGDWDGQFTDPGAVVYHDGNFHIFRNGFVGWPAPVGIAYAVSPDGATWSEPSAEPVMDFDGVEYVTFTALASSALVEEDGIWVLYLYTWDRRIGATAAASKIIRATAPAPTGPWTADPAPLLLPGGEGEWDSLALRAPSVVKQDGRYLMYYAGYTRQGMSIGMATSEDGITWEKYDDPSTTEAPYAESDPIFVAGEEGTWDSENVYQPRVVATPDGLFMLYSHSGSVNGANALVGYAYSADGYEWVRSEDSVLRPGLFDGGLAIWFTEMVHHDGATYVFLEIGTGGETEIYLATREEPLPVD